ncbi:MAG: mechanosensitive ion channel family protein [Parabacteroides sp.]|nr:mechanosensitive ion channel family protein [Parabacteroides sp.]
MFYLKKWINEKFISWGIKAETADMLNEIVLVGLLIFITVGLNFLIQVLFIDNMKKLTKHIHFQWISILLKRKVIYHLIHGVLAIFVHALLPFILIKGKDLLFICQKLIEIYFIIEFILAINCFLSAFLELYNQHPQSTQRPIKGLIQILQILLFFVGGILLVSIIINRSPASLFAGLGASAAILMLVFKDSILGFVAGIQLSVNDMLQPGDWITIPNMKIDGIVQEITLNTVKVQNFDNTISTIPPYTLVSNSFQNWRGMIQSEGRRVQKNITLDLQTIKFCTPEFINRLTSEIPLLAHYTPEEGQIPTNSQLFRLYIEKYLASLPVVNTDLDLIISQKQATEYGVPIQIYFFSRNKIWAEYERIQSDIFDHLFAMIPFFELKVYQFGLVNENL